MNKILLLSIGLLAFLASTEAKSEEEPKLSVLKANAKFVKKFAGAKKIAEELHKKLTWMNEYCAKLEACDKVKPAECDEEITADNLMTPAQMEEWTTKMKHMAYKKVQSSLYSLRKNIKNDKDDKEYCTCLPEDVTAKFAWCDKVKAEAVDNKEDTSKDCYDGTMPEYDGTLSQTEKGYTCQRWDTNSPHEVFDELKPSDMPDNSFAHNYCRYIGAENRPWCYTTDPDKRWDFCAINFCNCYDGELSSYNGTMSHTEEGFTCQRWDANSPHVVYDQLKPSMMPDNSFAHNYCRTIGAEDRPWCYTTHPEKRWDFCPTYSCVGK